MNYLNWPVGRIATQIPGATAVFFENKINFCCLGDKTLAEVIEQKQLKESPILDSLDILSARTNTTPNWQELDNKALIEHIYRRFHLVHREQLPELIRLAERVETVHHDHPLCPRGLSEFLTGMKGELEQHMQKEEMALFPMLSADFAPMVGGPISVMRSEHEEHMADIENIYRLTRDISLHPDACNTWQALYLGLREFISDLHTHIHLENDVLFERATKH